MGCRLSSKLMPYRAMVLSRRRERGQRALEERLGLKSTVQVGREAAAPPTVTAPPADIETGGGNGGATSEIQAAPES